MAARQPAGQTQRPFGQPPCYSLRTHLRRPDVGGRALHVVNAIATNWGVTIDGHDKTTWFGLRLTSHRAR